MPPSNKAGLDSARTWLDQGFVESAIQTGGAIMGFHLFTALFLSWVGASLTIGLLMFIGSLGQAPRNEFEPYK
jgi:hypothetical protein